MTKRGSKENDVAEESDVPKEKEVTKESEVVLPGANEPGKKPPSEVGNEPEEKKEEVASEPTLKPDDKPKYGG